MNCNDWLQEVICDRKFFILSRTETIYYPNYTLIFSWIKESVRYIEPSSFTYHNYRATSFKCKNSKKKSLIHYTTTEFSPKKKKTCELNNRLWVIHNFISFYRSLMLVFFYSGGYGCYLEYKTSEIHTISLIHLNTNELFVY